jgi:hypothetical protein
MQKYGMFLLQTKHASFCKYFFFFCCLFQAVNSANLKNLFGRQSCIHDRFHAQMFFVFCFFFCKKNEEKKQKQKALLAQVAIKHLIARSILC